MDQTSCTFKNLKKIQINFGNPSNCIVFNNLGVSFQIVSNINAKLFTDKTVL